MKRIHCLLIVLICAFSMTYAQEKNDSTRVLFIGNSYTYYHDMPQIVQNIAANIAQSQRMKIAFKMCTPGGWSLKKHSESKDDIAAINEGHWDYVVLQEQSAAPAKPTKIVAEETYPYVRTLCKLIRSANPKAKIIFYMTWGHKDGCQEPMKNYPLINTYQGMQQRLITSYLEMAYDNDAWCAPVGLVWKRIRSERPYCTLYWPDGSHPSDAGSYLAANVIFATIFQKTYQSTYMKGIDPELAEYIQQLAQQTVLENRLLLNLDK